MERPYRPGESTAHGYQGCASRFAPLISLRRDLRLRCIGTALRAYFQERPHDRGRSQSGVKMVQVASARTSDRGPRTMYFQERPHDRGRSQPGVKMGRFLPDRRAVVSNSLGSQTPGWFAVDSAPRRVCHLPVGLRNPGRCPEMGPPSGSLRSVVFPRGRTGIDPGLFDVTTSWSVCVSAASIFRRDHMIAGDHRRE